ncbi:MAG: hypothetical protein HUJ51_04440 [Eggerthellaceae bacterium]|nr:hypothetical protein [Eggerthellaceae bacterium]
MGINLFQKYNTILYQIVLANVEIAFTLSGFNTKKLKELAMQLLCDEGLTEHTKKNPDKESGCQILRVPIVPALINNLDIVLAEDLIGALDYKTSLLFISSLKKIANDCLVAMVMHNQELAEEYITQIVKFRDGKITEDSMLYAWKKYAAIQLQDNDEKAKKNKNMCLSFKISLWFSLIILMTKIYKIIFTAAAGSIRIIGIAAIFSISSSIRVFIKGIEQRIVSSYLISIASNSFDIRSFIMNISNANANSDESEVSDEKKESLSEILIINSTVGSMGQNDLQTFKKVLNNNELSIGKDCRSVDYQYGIQLDISDFKFDVGVVKINSDTNYEKMRYGLISTAGNPIISTIIMSTIVNLSSDISISLDGYDAIADRLVQNVNEVVFITTQDGRIPDFILRNLRLKDRREDKKSIEDLIGNKHMQALDSSSDVVSLNTFLNIRFKYIHPADKYQFYHSYNIRENKSGDSEFIKKLLKSSPDLTIDGILLQGSEANMQSMSTDQYFTVELVSLVIAKNAKKHIAQDQLLLPEIDVFSSLSFSNENAVSSNFNHDKHFSYDSSALLYYFCFAFLEIADSSNASTMARFNINMASIQAQLLLFSGPRITEIIANPDSAKLNQFSKAIIVCMGKLIQYCPVAGHPGAINKFVQDHLEDSRAGVFKVFDSLGMSAKYQRVFTEAIITSDSNYMAQSMHVISTNFRPAMERTRHKCLAQCREANQKCLILMIAKACLQILSSSI